MAAHFGDKWAVRGIWIILAIIYHNVGDTSFPKNLIAPAVVSLWLATTNSTIRKYLRMLLRDARALYIGKRTQSNLKKLAKQNKTVPTMFYEVVKRNSNKIMIFFENEEWSFQKVDEYSNQIANYFAEKGIKEGDNVALFTETCAEYIPIFLGFAKMGVSVSLINNSLTEKSLLHCLRITPTKAVIYGYEKQEALRTISKELDEIQPFLITRNPAYSGADNNAEGISKASKNRPPPPINAKPTNKLLYIFTSGTTGMPKGVVITHFRYITLVTLIKEYCRNMSDEDRIYVSLPLYHTNAICLSVGSALIRGCSVALRKKFSASKFWEDCIRYKCTAFIYIGEVCRYLLAREPSPQDRQHNVRLMVGNGLRSTIWQPFTQRFNIDYVYEFYGSTEGIGNMLNTECKVGAVGSFPWLWPKLMPMQLVEIDEETEMPKRGSDGKCIRVTRPGIPGMHICKITKEPGTIFDGYSDTKSTEKKIISDVFKKGDRYYVSGDTLILDDEFFAYFHDRTGDTFRWKGENVATTEVEQVISNVIALCDAAVYGVEIPGIEGKAGMVAIHDEKKQVDLTALSRDLNKHLPKYAKPIFVRLLEENQLTATYKLKKKSLKDEGFNPSIVSDKIFYLNPKEDSYAPLTEEVYDQIVRGRIQF